MAWEEGRHISKASVLPQAGWVMSSVQLVTRRKRVGFHPADSRKTSERGGVRISSVVLN